jgi:8-oxo-dGTP diphosphatase
MNHTVICGSIVCDGDSVLLVQENKDRAYGEWNLPTGKVEPDESLKQCAIREAQEEAGILIEPEKVVGIYSKPGEKTDVVLVVIFHSRAEDYKIAPDENEVLDAEWVRIEEVSDKNLRSSHIEPALRDYQSNSLYSLDILTSLQEK